MLPGGLGAGGGALAVIEMASASGLALLAADQRDPPPGLLHRHRPADRSGGGHGRPRGAARDRRKRDARPRPRRPGRTRPWIRGRLRGADGFARARRLAAHRGPGGRGSRVPSPRSSSRPTSTTRFSGPRGGAGGVRPPEGAPAAGTRRPLRSKAAGLPISCAATLEGPHPWRPSPGRGAAGGIAFGLMAATGATLLQGFDLVSAWIDLDARLRAADIVVTGEGPVRRFFAERKGPGHCRQARA